MYSPNLINAFQLISHKHFDQRAIVLINNHSQLCRTSSHEEVVSQGAASSHAEAKGQYIALPLPSLKLSLLQTQ
jgi:hypothetical protein